MGLLNSIIKTFVGDKTKKDLKQISPLVDKINKYQKNLESLNHDKLRKKTEEFKSRLFEKNKMLFEKVDLLKKEVETTDDIDEKENLYKEIDKLNEDIQEKTDIFLNEILPEAFAVIKETARRFVNNSEIKVKATTYDRQLSQSKSYVNLTNDFSIWSNSWDAAGKPITWDMVHYDVQLVGGIALHQGKIAEMQTGEGKTLVATLPVYLNALTGKGVHLVTVNDYLAKRDSAWMAPLFEFHGLSVDCIDHHPPNSPERRNAYRADITYGTNNEFGFDYLRDNMAHTIEDLVQPKHNFAIVDEVDFVLIDDARTPLIISGPTPQGDRHEFDSLKSKVNSLVTKQRNLLNNELAEAKNKIKSGDNNEGGIKLLRVFRGLPKKKALIKFLSEEGVKQLLQKTENHYMQDNNREMHIIDAELYFVIDEKNNQIDLTDKGIEVLSQDNSDPNFFILPDIGAEIAKIESKEKDPKKEAKLKEELFKDFDLKSERIHSLNQLLKAYTLFEKDVEYVVMDNKVKIVDEQTGRIMEGRRYSDGLHQAIEAKESVKIEAATQTYATITLQNYFRMYQKLSGMTGTAITEAGEFWEIYKLDVIEIPTNKPIARKDENDLIYKSKREKYNAVIETVSKLTSDGRPVLIGTTSVEISELLSKMLNIRKIKHNVLNAKLHKKEAEIVAEAGNPGIVTIATNMAGRGTDIKLGDGVKDSGGLAIIGTERHDSRRVDRQLRGRAGRQGDPGSSQFYVSLEDKLMRLFGSERIAKLMDRMGLEDGEVIQHSMVSKSIERAQKKVEENNFGVRKRLLEYDDVMNQQREVIYKKRRYALHGDRLSVDIANMIYDTCESIVNEWHEIKDYNSFELDLIRLLAIQSPISKNKFDESTVEEITELVYQKCYENYKHKSEFIAQKTYPVIKDIFENKSATYENIIIPFTDGIKTLQVVTNLKEANDSKCENIAESIEKSVMLAIIDDVWKEHLREMDDLKQSVQNAVYEQKDPLLIYKFESFELFKALIEKINKEIITFLLKATLPTKTSAQEERYDSQINLQTSRPEQSINTRTSQSEQPQKTQPIKVEQKAGRNEKVTITNGSETRELKWKKAQPLVESGKWTRI